MYERDTVIPGLGVLTAGARSPLDVFDRIEAAGRGLVSTGPPMIESETWNWLKRLAPANESSWERRSVCSEVIIPELNCDRRPKNTLHALD